MDIEGTKAFYAHIGRENLCGCAFCRNYIKEIRASYPALARYLRDLGVDIEKPFETMPLDPDGEGHIDYLCAQYIICGSQAGFKGETINGVSVNVSESHPSTGVGEPHFVIEASPIRLKWEMQTNSVRQSWRQRPERTFRR